MKPSISETLTYLKQILPRPPLRILDVGCGYGEITLALKEAGYDLVAIDHNEERVHQARRLGVHATCENFLKYNEGPFDAIYFGRSFHHIHPIDEAIAHIKTLVRKNGMFILEEFAWENVDAFSAEWFFRHMTLIRAFVSIDDVFSLKDGDDALRRWQHLNEHDPQLHRGDAMVNKFRTCFANVTVENCAYLYRYFGHLDVPLPLQEYLEVNLLSLENGLLQRGAMSPVGLRMHGVVA